MPTASLTAIDSSARSAPTERTLALSSWSTPLISAVSATVTRTSVSPSLAPASRTAPALTPGSALRSARPSSSAPGRKKITDGLSGQNGADRHLRPQTRGRPVGRLRRNFPQLRLDHDDLDDAVADGLARQIGARQMVVIAVELTDLSSRFPATRPDCSSAPHSLGAAPPKWLRETGWPGCGRL